MYGAYLNHLTCTCPRQSSTLPAGLGSIYGYMTLPTVPLPNWICIPTFNVRCSYLLSTHLHLHLHVYYLPPILVQYSTTYFVPTIPYPFHTHTHTHTAFTLALLGPIAVLLSRARRPQALGLSLLFSPSSPFSIYRHRQYYISSALGHRLRSWRPPWRRKDRRIFPPP